MDRSKNLEPPTREEFAEFRRIAIGPSLQSLMDFEDVELDFELKSNPSRGVELFLARLDSDWEEFRRLIENSAVGIWLGAHPTSERAWTAAHRSKKSSSPHESHTVRAERIVESCYRDRTLDDVVRIYGSTARKNGVEVARTPQDLQNLLKTENSEEQRRSRLKRRLEGLMKQDRYSVGSGVASAFEDYFYGSSFFHHAIKPAEVRKQASELLDAIAVFEDPTRWAALGLGPLRLASYHRRQTDRLRSLRENPPVSPIRKLDETAPDRFLAYSLWRVFQRAYRSNRTTAIYNFMQFYGVKNAPDARSVERWVKDWQRGAKMNRDSGGNFA